MDKLKQLISQCRCGVYVTVNPHKDMLESVEEYLDDGRLGKEAVDAGVLGRCAQLDTLIHIQFYPDQHTGHDVFHYDLDKALDEALLLFD